MSTIKGEDGRNNTGLRIIHRIIHTFYVWGRMGKMSSELRGGGGQGVGLEKFISSEVKRLKTQPRD